MVKQIIIIIIITFWLVSCSNESSIERRKNTINSLLHTGKVCDKIEANFLIGEIKDTSYLPLLLADMNDYSTCATRLRYKGISVYESKISALEKIANLDTQLIYTHRPDSEIIKIFLKRFKYKSEH
jgi:hypothetical protein